MESLENSEREKLIADTHMAIERTKHLRGSLNKLLEIEMNLLRKKNPDPKKLKGLRRAAHKLEQKINVADHECDNLIRYLEGGKKK